MGQSASTPTTIASTPVTIDNEKSALAKQYASRHQIEKLTTNMSKARLSSSAATEGLAQNKLNAWESEFEATPTLKLSQLLLSTQSPTASLITRGTKIADQHIFNLALKRDRDENWKVTNQKSSGRCWLFATSNCLRYKISEHLNLGEWQLSQSYLFFYDKLEKANYYLENMIDLADEPLDSRLISYLNIAPVNDGGQFDMAVNILEKYGCCPQVLYPESWTSSNSATINTLITSKLKEYALELRSILSSSCSSSSALSKSDLLATVRTRKEEMMETIYQTLCVSMGTPPKADDKLVWEYLDKDKKAQKLEITPLELYKKYTGPYLASDCFSIINDPRNKYDTLYTVDRLGNVMGGHGIRYVNQETKVLEDAVIKCIKYDQPVFFGCDVGKSLVREEGIMDEDAYQLKMAFGYELKMTKAERLFTGDSSATHAMVITAVHLDSAGRPVRYRIENSWSDANGDKGFFLMTAEWFRQYVYQVVVPKKLAEKKSVEILEGGNPVVLPSWDPMGALA